MHSIACAYNPITSMLLRVQFVACALPWLSQAGNPSPAPGVCPPYTVYPAPGCNCAYDKTKCASLHDTSAGSCSWCTSKNGNHALCFAAQAATSLSKDHWSCGAEAELDRSLVTAKKEISTDESTPQKWAVIVAGSKVYSNYRHQADACHAYKILTSNGIPASNIIMIMQDDISNDPQNPFPGKLFNKQDKAGQGQDVYYDCAPDYTGDAATHSTFLSVLTGNQTQKTPKVLKSTSADNVFVYFVDHGAPGEVDMPEPDSDMVEKEALQVGFLIPLSHVILSRDSLLSLR